MAMLGAELPKLWGQVAPMAALCGHVGRRIAVALVNLWRVSKALARHRLISTSLYNIARLRRGGLGTLSVPASTLLW